VLVFKNAGLATPESVLYDDAADLYLVSNINGSPVEADGNGFIARLSPDGSMSALKWIEGGKNKVILNAPKGLAITGNRLYVADLDTVRIFDKKTGAPTGEVKIPGATFVNDLSASPDGRVFVSDTGMKGGAKGLLAKGFEPAGNDAVYAIDKDNKVQTVAKSKDLGGPNGVLAGPDKTWVVTFGTGELYSLDAKGSKGDTQKLPKGRLDGIVPLGTEVLISSWEGEEIFRGKPGGEFRAVIEGVKSPADIGYDTKRARLLVPVFQENEVRAYEVK
jgi:sugar lactone lactonase YvrE